MSLDSLPPLTTNRTKPNFTSAIETNNEGGGDFLLSAKRTESNRLIGKSDAYHDQDGCARNDKIPGRKAPDVPENGKCSQIYTADTTRLQDKRTERQENGILRNAQLVNHGICTQHREAANLNNSLDEAMEKSPITRAIMRGEQSLVLESLRQGESPHSVCAKSGQSYLHIISWHASNDKETSTVPMIYQLSNTGIDLNHKDHSGLSAARVAIRRKLVQVLAALLKCGAELGAAELEEAELVRGVARNDMLEVVRRFHPGYWEAVLDPNSFKVSRLVKAWARINISRPCQGLTLIEFAKKNARDETVVKLLLQHEASIELAHAVMAGDSQRAKVLLCNGGADLSTVDFSVRSAAQHTFAPLSLTGAAEKYGHLKVLRLLQAREASVPKSASNSPVRNPYFNYDGFASKKLCNQPGTADDVQMAGPPTSALCTIL